MRSKGLFIPAIFGLLLSAAAGAQPESAASSSSVSYLQNGIEVQDGSLHERITALRDDVLRIRIWRGDTPPEDASWAVLAEARHACAPVMKEEAGKQIRV